VGYLLKLLVCKPVLDSIDTEGSIYPGHTRYYHLDELCNHLENIGFKITHQANMNYLPPVSYYKNRLFALLKNTIVRIVPSGYSTHIERVAGK
jgi:hypothetical protein